MAEKFSGNLRKPPSNVGSSSEISANLPTTLAARRRFPPSSLRKAVTYGHEKKKVAPEWEQPSSDSLQ